MNNVPADKNPTSIDYSNNGTIPIPSSWAIGNVYPVSSYELVYTDADKSVPINAAIEAAYAAGGGVVVLSNKDYIITNPIKFRPKVTIQGQGYTTLTGSTVNTRIRPNANINAFQPYNSTILTNSPSIQNLTLDLAYNDACLVGFYIKNVSYGLFENISILYSDTNSSEKIGISIDSTLAGYYNHFRNINHYAPTDAVGNNTGWYFNNNANSNSIFGGSCVRLRKAVKINSSDQNTFYSHIIDGTFVQAYTLTNASSNAIVNSRCEFPVPTVTSLTRTSNVVTVVTASAHYFQNGATVKIYNATDTSFNGTFTISSIVNSTTFTYAQTAANATTTGYLKYGIGFSTDANCRNNLINQQQFITVATPVSQAVYRNWVIYTESDEYKVHQYLPDLSDVTVGDGTGTINNYAQIVNFNGTSQLSIDATATAGTVTLGMKDATLQATYGTGWLSNSHFLPKTDNSAGIKLGLASQKWYWGYFGSGGVFSNGPIMALGHLRLAGSASATTPGSVVKKIAIYDENDNLLGYLPIYSTIT